MILKQKSEENINAAKMLAESKNGCYASSIHCSYYSSLQLVMYILCNKYNISYKVQEENGKLFLQGTHNYLIDEIGVRLSKKHEPRIVRKIQNNIRELKTLRKEADYKPVVIDNMKAQYAISLSDTLMEEFKKYKAI